MLKRRISTLTLLALMNNNISLPVYALEKSLNSETAILNKVDDNIIYINKFDLYNNSKLEEYNKTYKIDNSKISSVTNNGGKYASSSIDKATDNNFSTHWETGKPNSESFTNEVIVTFDEVESLNRIVYASRQDGAKGKGFAQEVEIYSSLTNSEDDFKLVGTGTYSGSTGDVVEMKFNTTEFKRLKFVFKKANQNWASASEIMFYKEDTLLDKAKNIFTDSTKSKVSDDFNTIDKINEFEKEFKNHALYENYKEDLENARILLSEGKIESKEANVSKFDVYYTDQKSSYDEAFKMDNSNISQIVSSGGNLRNSFPTKNITDENLSTYWETAKQSSESFKNELTFTFKESTVLNRIAYRSAGNTVGFAEEFEIWASNTSEGDTFQLVSTGKAQKTKDMVEIKFEPTNFKRLKFVFKNNGTATASEMMFYKEDKAYDSLSNMFTNGLMNELKPEFTAEKISELESQIQNHPLKEKCETLLNKAKELLQNPDKYKEGIVVASQRGDINKEAREHQIIRPSYSLDTFGKYVTPGETINVYVDADENGVMPQLVFGQIADEKNGWSRFYNLKPGLNTITAPSFDNMSPAIIYVYNPATPSEQAYAPKVRVEGGTSFPVYYHGKTDPAEYEKELREYVKKVSNNDNDFANGVRTDVYYNVTELVSENNTISTTAKGALKGIEEMKAYNKTVFDTMNDWETLWREFNLFSGFSENADDPRNEFYPAKYTSRVFTDGAYGWSAFGYTGYSGGNTEERDSGNFKQIVKPFSLNDDWLFYHEWGHSINNSMIEDLEVTNNLYSAQMRRIFNTGNQDDRIAWNELYKRFSGETVNTGYFTHLGVISQPLYYYGLDTYGKASAVARTNPDGVLDNLENDKQRLVVAYSVAVGRDLTDFFDGWGYCEATDLMKSKVSNLPKPEVKLEYMHTSGLGYEGEGFDENTNVYIESISSDVNSNQNIITFNVDKENKDDVMGYEIIRDGEVVGYTVSNSFVDKNIDPNKEYIYEVVAYAKDLTTSKKATMSSKTPSILANEKITLKLNETFNPLNYVNAFDSLGNKIENIEFTHNVDTTKKGTYEVTYNVVSDNVPKTKTVEVEVVSSYDYLSDSNWTSTRTDYGSTRKNNNLKLFVNGEVKEFEKGFGTHANGEIVYNLEDNNYEKFEAYVGVSRAIAEQNNSSIIFKIFADGKEVYNSGLMKYKDEAKFVSIDVKGVDELKIVVDNGGNGNSSDHAVIANAILTTNSVKPIINFGSSDAIVVGSTTNYDLMKNVSATDVEDGDLTEKIVVNDNGFNINKPGHYNVVYSVTDSDGNVTNVEKSVVVYNESTYLSDLNWESASIGSGYVQKDKAVSGNALRLLDENGNVETFKKGIGTHSYSEIVYNSEGYDTLDTWVGVDQKVSGQTSPSVVFKVYVDGVLKAQTDVMKSNTPKERLVVDIRNSSEVKLVVDVADNGNNWDHANWADAKFLKFGEAINTESLESLIEQVNNVNKDDFTTESFENLMNVLETVKAGLSDGYTQEEVDNLYNVLKQAFDSLQKATDFSSLQQAIENNSNYNELHYYKEQMDSHKAVIEEAKAVLANANSTQEQVDEATNKVIESAKTLVVRENKVELGKLIEEAKAIENNNYNEVRWNNFLYGIDYAEQIYNNVDATDDEIYSGKFTLSYMKDELK